MALTKLNFSGSGLSSLPNGSVIQTVQIPYTDAFTNTTADQWLDVTGFEGSITCSTTSSKVLINLNLGRCGYYSNAIKVLRKIDSGSYADIGALGNSPNNSINVWGTTGTTSPSHPIGWSGTHLDTPSSTGVLTYKVQIQTYNTNYVAQVNRSGTINNTDTYASYAYSNMILQEIKA